MGGGVSGGVGPEVRWHHIHHSRSHGLDALGSLGERTALRVLLPQDLLAHDTACGQLGLMVRAGVRLTNPNPNPNSNANPD